MTTWAQCLTNLAIGDALGYPLEFNKAPTPRDVAEVARGPLLISDDTQMTLFTCMAIRSGIPYEQAYLDWYCTQIDAEGKSALSEEELLRHPRVPGNTTMDALSFLRNHYKGRPMTPPKDMGSGNGCGGLMRVAPIAFAYGPRAIKEALRAARVTHMGWKSDIAVVAYISLLQGLLVKVPSLGAHVAADVACHAGRGTSRYFERLWQDSIVAKNIEEIGGGFYADECLMMGLYAAINCEGSFMRGMGIAICHAGDSDSVAAVAGTIMGAMGIAAPQHLFDKVVEAPIIRPFMTLPTNELRANFRQHSIA